MPRHWLQETLVGNGWLCLACCRASRRDLMASAKQVQVLITVVAVRFPLGAGPGTADTPAILVA